MSHPIVIAAPQATSLIVAHRNGEQRAVVSLDLGLSTGEARLSADGVIFPGGEALSWAELARIQRDAPTCFVVEGGAQRIHRFSTMLNRPYTLIATAGAPTLINSGFTMHRIVDVDPQEDTARKLRALGAPHGTVLDTATGLGYTAIAAARTAQVLTIEIDPLVLEIARLNPWSRALFDNPRIEQRIGDTAALIETLGDEHFTAIVHDPPTVALAGELYGGAFYDQLFRVLRRGGALFHYVGNLSSKQGGTVARGVVRRLRAAGFSGITPRPEAFGIVAR
ncbi:MAG TPA: spermine synthase, partial [Chloroflexota bacterium]|nr:spermine synthase [Chloroflexota bacterium]